MCICGLGLVLHPIIYLNLGSAYDTTISSRHVWSRDSLKTNREYRDSRISFSKIYIKSDFLKPKLFKLNTKKLTFRIRIYFITNLYKHIKKYQYYLNLLFNFQSNLNLNKYILNKNSSFMNIVLNFLPRKNFIYLKNAFSSKNTYKNGNNFFLS